MSASACHQVPSGALKQCHPLHTAAPVVQCHGVSTQPGHLARGPVQQQRPAGM